MKTLLIFFTLSILAPSLQANPNDHAGDDTFWAQAAALLPNHEPLPIPPVSNNAGLWGELLPWPHVPVTIATLPNGRLLTYSGQEVRYWPGTEHKTQWGIWNPETGQFETAVYDGHEMFCSHPVMRTDGVFQTTGSRFRTNQSSIYDWRTNAWSEVENMNEDRWYPTAVALPNGDITSFAGSNSNDTAERYDHNTDQWNLLGGVDWQDISDSPGHGSHQFPFIMVAPNGELFHFGPTDQMHWINPYGNGTMTTAGVTVPESHYPHDGGIVMYGSGKYLIAGGAASSTAITAGRFCFTVDLNTTPPTVERTGNLNFARSLLNIVALPSGEVVAIGGNTTGTRFSDGNSILPAEIWNPATGNWRQLSSMAIPRNYHSTAALLPDGRIFSGGGGYRSNTPDTSITHQDAQLFTPPALLDNNNNPRPRPTLSSAPDDINIGSVFNVSATPGMSRFTMIRMMAITHGVCSDQRFLDMPFAETSNGQYQIVTHPNHNVMVPGYWMLFATDEDGVYSEAQIIKVNELVDEAPLASEALVTGDDRLELYLDGELLAVGTNAEELIRTNLPNNPRAVIGIRVVNNEGFGGFVGQLDVAGETIPSSSNWKVSTSAPNNWTLPSFDDSAWSNATIHNRSLPADLPSNSLAQWIGLDTANTTGELFFRFQAGSLHLAAPSSHSLTINTPLELPVEAGGGVPPYTFSAVGLPSGFAISSSTGTITGTTGNTGIHSVAITVTDSENENATTSLDLAITNELVIGENFNSNAGGFTYSDNLFRSANQAAYASGTRATTGGVSNSGALRVDLGGIDSAAINNMSGGWTYNLNLLSEQRVEIDFQYRLTTDDGYEPEEFSEVLFAHNGTLLGLNGNDYLTRISGGGDSGWLSASFDLGLLSAGNHTLSLGGFNNRKTVATEATQVHFDNLQLTLTPLPNNAPTLASIPDQEITVGTAVNLLTSASDPEGDTITYTANGLPNGLSINPTTGRITGTSNTAGDFSPLITATDSAGGSNTSSFAWTINPVLELPETVTTPSTSGSETTFSVSFTGGTNPSFLWNFGDGTPDVSSTSPTVNHTFQEPGRYLITLTANDANGETTTINFRQLIQPNLTTIRPRNSQPIITTASGQVWNVNPDQNTVTVHQIGTHQKLAEIAVGNNPRTLAESPSGFIWVINQADATVSVIDPTSNTVSDTFPLPRGSQPYGLVFSPDETSAWIALEALGEVAQLNPASGNILTRAPVGSSPRHLAINHDSSRLFASRFISPLVPGESTANPDLSNAGGFVAEVNTSTLAVTDSIRLLPSSSPDFAAGARGLPNYLGGAALSPANDFAWIPSKQDNIQRGTLRDGLGLTHDNTLRAITSKLNLATSSEVVTARIDHDDASVPSAALFGPRGLFVFVAMEGSREVAVIDTYGNNELFRIPVERAPQGLALSPNGDLLYVHNFLSRSLSVLDISALVTNGLTIASTLDTLNATAGETLSPEVLLGKQIFYDAFDDLIGRDDYISCASCHNAGGHDGRTWDFTGFGEGLRNTIDLRGRGGPEHGPLHWSANFDEFQDFENQIINLNLGTGLITNGTPHPPTGTPNAGRSPDLDALAAYMESLQTVPDSPYRNDDGSRTAEALAGQDLFVSKNCIECHGGPAFTDSGVAFHDIGTLTANSGQRLGTTLPGLDTPSLLAVWDSAPYLHDGSEATLSGAIAAHSNISTTAAERDTLVAYLQQLEGDSAQTPTPSLAFGGTPTPLPGRLEVENYDTGGQGVSYNDTDPENFGANFGPNLRDEGVDLETSNDIDSTPAIGWIEPGEWSEYTVTLTAGSYNIVARAASELTIPGSIRVLLDGVSLGEIDIQSTAGWYLWQDFTLPNITVASGQAVLRLEYQGSSFNLNWLEFRDPSATPPPPVTDNQTPFNGVAATIPGTIQAENFDEGGLGVAYLDSEEENFGLTYTGLNYRSSGVDIEASFDTNATPSLGWTDPGEWMEYTVEVTPGTYDLQARVASGFALPGDLAVELDGRNLGVIPVTGTGDWYNWETLTIPNVAVTESGTHILRLQFTGAAGFNLNWVKFDDGSVTPPPSSGQSPFGGTAHAIPGRVEAEDYDLGGEGIAYSDADPENLGGSYRGDAVDIESSGDSDGSFSVGWFDNAQWMEYTLATTPGIYQLNLRVASNETSVGDVRVSLDGVVLGTIDVQSTGSWTNWVTLTLPNIAITNGGEQVLRLEMVGDAVNINWFELQQTSVASNLAFATVSETGAQADAMEDSDGDNTSNLAEFAFGSNSGSSASQPVLPVGFDHEGNCCQTVPVAVGGNLGHNTYQAAGLIYTFQGSTDLENWNEEITFLANPQNVPPPPSGYRYLTFRLTETDNEVGYLRVLVTQQSE